MSRAEPPESTLRYAPPVQLILYAVLFVTPWVEIECVGGKNLQPGPFGSLTVVEQTGLEAATGDMTIGSRFRAEIAQIPPDKRPEPSLLLWVSLAAAAIGVVVGFAMPVGLARKAILVVCCLLTVGCIGGQAAIGFPVEKMIPAFEAEAKKREPTAAFVFRTRYTVFFYATVAVAGGALLTALIDRADAGTPSRRRRRRDDEDDDDRDRRRDWEDEDDYDEDRGRDRDDRRRRRRDDD
jgi:hypothetical protein